MIDIIGFIAGFLAMISFVPQIIKTLKKRRADDISMAMLMLTLITNILYIIYGYLLNLYPIIIMIGILSFIIIFQIIFTFKYSNRVSSG